MHESHVEVQDGELPAQRRVGEGWLTTEGGKQKPPLLTANPVLMVLFLVY